MNILIKIEDDLMKYERDPYNESNLLRIAETLKNIEAEYEELEKDEKTKLDYLLRNYSLPSFKDFKENRKNTIDTYLTLLEEQIKVITKEQYEENKNLISDIVNQMIEVSNNDIKYEDLFSLSKDSDRKEFIKLVETYFEILKETNKEELLKNLILKISNKDTNIRKEGWLEITENINQLSTKQYFSKKDNKIILNAGKSGETDGEFYYLKNNILHSKSLSVTKAGESRFEGIQNNTHNLKTKLKNSILRKLIEINGENEEYLSTIMSQIRENKIKEGSHNLVHILNKMATINQSELLLMELKYSEEDIIDYLSMKTSYYKKITKKSLEYLSFNNVTIEDIDNYKENGLDNYLNSSKDKESVEKDHKQNEVNDFDIPNKKEHTHIFTIFNNGVFYIDDKKNQKLNTIITIFSHINNDMLDLKKSNIDKETVIKYIEKTIDIFKHLEVELVKITNKEGVKKQREDTSKIFTSNKIQNNSTISLIKNIIETIKDYEKTRENKNIIKSDMKLDNVKEAIGVLSFYLEHLQTLKENDKNNVLDDLKDTIDNSTSFQSETYLTVGYGEAKKELREKDKKREEEDRKREEEDRKREEEKELIQMILSYIKDEEYTLEEYIDSEVFTMEQYEKYRIKAEEEIFWSKIPGLKSIKLKKEYKKRLLSLPEFIVDKYFSKSEDEEKIREQISGMRKNKLQELADVTEEELEKAIQEILKLEKIDITKKDSEKLNEEIKKVVTIRFKGL